MTDTAVSSRRGGAEASAVARPARWLMLIHQLPAEPAYLRVKVLRRLKAVGAAALKNSVYLLPDREGCREDFEWTIREIVDAGGSATLSHVRFLEGTSDAELRALFDGERDREYAEVAAAAERVIREGAARGELGRLERALRDVRQRDQFGAAGRALAERALQSLADALEQWGPNSAPGGERKPNGAVWVTRSGVFVDRMASAWLIRRCIDPRARFRFVPASRPGLRAGEIPFDMFEGGYTHEGERCTFETLVARFGLTEPGLGPLAEIVHDIDCKDHRFGRPETEGVAALLRGIAAAHAGDEDRIEAASVVFEGLLRAFAGGEEP